MPRNRVGDDAEEQDQHQEPSGGHGPSPRRAVPRCPIEERDEAHGERQQGKDRQPRCRYRHEPSQARSRFRAVSGRSHRETWVGCIVSLTTPTSSSFSASRSVSSLSLTEKASRVFLASYFLR